MERTGHRSMASLHQYQRPSEEEEMLVSHLLDDGEMGNEGATEDTRTFKRLCVGRKQDAEKAVSTTTGKGTKNCTMHINNSVQLVKFLIVMGFGYGYGNIV